VETPWNLARPPARILPAPLVKARDDARELLSAAETRAAGIIDRAEHEAESIRSAAREAGRDEGLAYAQRLLVEIQQARRRTLEGEALRRSVSELARAVLEVAAPLRRSAVISLRVAPASAPAVRERLSAERAAGMVEVVGDPTLDEAGCVAVSSCGRVDGRLSTMLASFRGPLGLEEPG